MTAMALGFAGFLAMLVLFQDRLLYLPETSDLPALLATAERAGLTAWPGTDDYRGLIGTPADAPRGTLILFHGNAGHAGDRLFYAQRLMRRGLRVILAEYPGYGPRPGKPGEAVLIEDARQTISLARAAFGGPLILAGESLGAAVVAAAGNGDERSALLLITPWDELARVARHHYPWLPVGWLLRDRYESAAHLAGYQGRVGVVLAEQDRIVTAASGYRLYESLAGPKRLWVVPSADHNDWMARVDDAWWDAVVGYLLQSE